MGSDETNPEEFDIEAAIYESVRESSKESRPEEDSLRDLKSWKSPDHALWQEHPRDLDALQNAQRGACMVIQRCAEDGIETVDLTYVHFYDMTVKPRLSKISDSSEFL